MNYFLLKLKTYGVIPLLILCVKRAFIKVGLYEDLRGRKLRLASEIDASLQSTVHYGYLKGYIFGASSWWSKLDRVSMLLGFYEEKVINILHQGSSDRNVFIDIGAADGYYGVGCVFADMFDESYCFEISSKGREVILENAVLNGVANKVTVLGEGNASSLAELLKPRLGRCVVLIDIEGAEFSLLDKDCISVLKHERLVIELHDFMVDSGEAALEELRMNLQSYFSIYEFYGGSRNPSKYQELSDLSENDQWLLCSEGRERAMKWWCCTPLEEGK